MKMKMQIANFMKDYESPSKWGDFHSVLTSLIKDLKRRDYEWDCDNENNLKISREVFTEK